MKFLSLLLILSVVEWHCGFSLALKLSIKNIIEKLHEGKNATVTCSIAGCVTNGSLSCTSCGDIYRKFTWRRKSTDEELKHVHIVNNGCSVQFFIDNVTSSYAARYECLLITKGDNHAVTKEMSINVIPHKSGQSRRCPITMIKCVRSSHCIFQRYRCDNYDDCKDGSDEHGCKSDICVNKFVCNNSRCIHRNLMCDGSDQCGDGSDEDDRCNKDEISSTADPNIEEDHFDWLKTTVYTVIGCTVAVVIFISFIVIVVFRVKMKRLRARRIARALERHRQHQGSNSQGRIPEQDPFLSIGSNSHYGNIIVNVNNGVQYVPTGDFAAFVDSPPPYNEVVESERDNSPPPPYSTIDRTPRQKAAGEGGTTSHSTSDLHNMQQPNLSMSSIRETEVAGCEGVNVNDISPSDINPPSYPASARESAGGTPRNQPTAVLSSSPAVPPSSLQQAPSNRSSSSLSLSSRDNNPSTSDLRSPRQQPSTSQSSLARPARLAVQGGKIVLSAEEAESSSNAGSSQDSLRPRQCHLEVKEGQIVLTDMTRSDLGVQSPLSADNVVRGTGELEVRDGQIIFRPKETS